MSENRPPPAPLMPVAEARARILAGAGARARDIEMVPIDAASGRVLAADLAAKRTQPPFDMSAMDGFALLAADTDPPGRPLSIVGESAAGHPFAGVFPAGSATRIYTGARLPDGADAVLVQELARVEGETLLPEITVKAGAHIRRRGRDFFKGDVLLGAGTRLAPRHIALAAGMNHAEIPAIRRPRIALLATGDELVPPGADAPPEATIASNVFAIAAMLREAGCETLDLGIARDTRESLVSAFSAAREAEVDCLVTIGGASVGKHDLVRHVAAELGAAQDFYKIAMRPGKPLSFGALGPMLLLGLPGNPVSAIVCARVFLMPLVAVLSGDTGAGIEPGEPAILGMALPANDEREDYLRAEISRDAAGTLCVSPASAQDSSMLGVLARAGALLIRPANAPAAAAGAPCRIIRL